MSVVLFYFLVGVLFFGDGWLAYKLFEHVILIIEISIKVRSRDASFLS